MLLVGNLKDLKVCLYFSTCWTSPRLCERRRRESKHSFSSQGSMLVEGWRVQAAHCGVDCVRVFSRCGNCGNWYTLKSPLKCLEVSAGSWERLGTGTPLGFQGMRCFKLYRYSINTQEKFIGFPRKTGTGRGPDHLGALGSMPQSHHNTQSTVQTS